MVRMAGKGRIINRTTWRPRYDAAARAKWVPWRRERLILSLGGQCVVCGVPPCHRAYVDGQPSHVAAGTSRWVRICRYEREAAAGLIVLRCRRCNAGYNVRDYVSLAEAQLIEAKALALSRE